MHVIFLGVDGEVMEVFLFGEVVGLGMICGLAVNRVVVNWDI